MPADSINAFKYQRFVIAYHGCNTLTREKVVLGEEFKETLDKKGHPLPENLPGFEGDTDKVRRILDCAFLNWVIKRLEIAEQTQFDTVRGLFPEGDPAFPGGSILKESHIQISVRNPGCILGYFMPKFTKRKESL